MYGIMAGCIAIMALFLGLFAVSVPPAADDQFAMSTDRTAQVQTVADQSAAPRQ